MMFYKSTLALSALLVLASAMTLERNVPAQEEMSIISIEVDPSASVRAAPFMVSKTDCEKEDEADCKDFCGQLEQTSACKASGNKVTCFCKGGKGGESKCEERCLFCAPDKSAFEEALKVGGPRIEDL